MLKIFNPLSRSHSLSDSKNRALVTGAKWPSMSQLCLPACIHQLQIYYSSDEGLCSTDSTSQLNIWAGWGSSQSLVASRSIVTDLFEHQGQPDIGSTNGAGQSVFKTNERLGKCLGKLVIIDKAFL